MHFKSQSQNWRKLEEQLGDEYWKLGSHKHITVKEARKAMAKRSFCCPREKRRDEIIDLLHKMERGLISYEGCSDVELRRFIRDRKIVLPVASPESERTMVGILQEADDHATFEKFGELPPETRSRIYAMSFEDFDLPLCPTQPPISKVSRLLRSEALPLFYSSCRFKVQVYRVLSPERRFSVLHYFDGFYYFGIDPKTEHFFNRTETAYVSRISRLNVHLQSKDCPVRVGWNVKLRADVDYPRAQVELDERTAEVLSRLERVYYHAESEKLIDAITPSLERTACEISARPVVHKLLKKDIDSFKKVFGTARPAGFPYSF